MCKPAELEPVRKILSTQIWYALADGFMQMNTHPKIIPCTF